MPDESALSWAGQQHVAHVPPRGFVPRDAEHPGSTFRPPGHPAAGIQREHGEVRQVLASPR
jgi:hypothetical protein